ncbi:MAG: hypothetical protein U0K19_00520 [Bifidobacteriaceae bacterium]|nr:hypothetical protein [Bifidobacteriaceae bacterium]
MGIGIPIAGVTVLFFTSQFDKAVKFAENPGAFTRRSGRLFIMIDWVLFY